MKKLLLSLALFAPVAEAQVPYPPVPVTAALGAGYIGPLFNSGILIFPSDASLTMSYPQMSAVAIKLTSSVSLTATRTLTVPLALGFTFTFYNDTSGGQIINVCGISGTCAAIPNNGLPYIVDSDGTNFYLANPTAGAGVATISIATANGFQGGSSGGTSPTLTINTDSSHFLPLNTAGSSCYWSGAGSCTVPAGGMTPSGMPTVSCNATDQPGAGTGATCSVTSASSNTGGFITVTTGTSPAANAHVVDLTFNGAPLSSPMGGCTITPAISYAATATPFITAFDGSNVNGWGIGDEGTALTAATTYEWSYVCSR